MGEKRSDERVAINREFESFAQFMGEYISDISPSGAFIRTRLPLPEGTLVALRFTVLAGEVQVIEGEGEVVRVSTEPPGMGVRFTRLTAASERVIERLVSDWECDEVTASMIHNPLPER